MKSTILLCVLAGAVGLGAFSMTSVGCGSNPCDDLRDECDKCPDPLSKGLCKAIPDAADETGSDDSCQSALDQGNVCGTAGPTSSTQASSPASSTTGMGGAGGMGTGGGGGMGGM